MVDEINVLGTSYKVIVKSYKDDPYFDKNTSDGYCDGLLHEIVLCDIATYPGCEDYGEEQIAAAMKHTLRHEIIHAFFNESGLQESGLEVKVSWSRNEEMIDWWAIQGHKVYAAWVEAGVA